MDELEHRVVPADLGLPPLPPPDLGLPPLPPPDSGLPPLPPPDSGLPPLPPPDSIEHPIPFPPADGTIPFPPADGDGPSPPIGFPPVDEDPTGDPGPIDPGPSLPPRDGPILNPPEDPAPPVINPPTDESPIAPVVSVQPQDGQELVIGEADAIAVTLVTPMARDGVPAGEFLLERIGASGVRTVIFGPSQPASWRLEDGGSTLLLRFPEPLGAGTYRLTLKAYSRFTTLGGEIIDGASTDELLSEFRVVALGPNPGPIVSPPPKPSPGPVVGVPAPGPKPAPAPTPTPVPSVPDRPGPKPVGVTLDQAIALGRIGPRIREVPGTLDLESDPASVRLYRIELAPGHFWRLGLEVSGDHDPAPMPTRLSLFDAEGRLIASSTLGIDSSPNDPFLFEGLDAGTYFVGVSSADNDPGAGGYDPATGAVGTNVRARSGGSFSLSLVADPADDPTRVLGVELNRADPADPVPTGLILRFDGPVRAWASDGLIGSSSSGTPVEVVDLEGRVWPAVAVSYDSETGALSLLFLDRLPTGRYEIRLPDSGGLVDLAGLPPVAEGLPDGVLGRFEITTVPTAQAPNNLGPLLPNRASEGVSVPLQLGAGASESIRFVVTFETQYELLLRDPSGSLMVELVGPDGPVRLDPDPTALNGTQVQLRPGIYALRVINSGVNPVDAILRLRALNPPRDSVPLNGVGQGPALGMRLVSPAAGLAPGASDPIGSPPSGSTLPASFPNAPGRSASPIGPGEGTQEIAVGEGGPSMPAGPMLTLDVELLGRPSTQALRVAAVGPELGNGLAATASVAEGSELFRAVAIGPGQSIGRPSGEPSWGGAAAVDAPAWSVADPGTGDGVVLETPESEPPGGNQAFDLIDEVLAMLPPVDEAIAAELAMLEPSLASDPPAEEAARRRDREPSGAEDDLPIQLVQALSAGLVVSWSARRWSQRRSRFGRRPGSLPERAPRCAISEAEDSAILNDLIRRHPDSTSGLLG